MDMDIWIWIYTEHDVQILYSPLETWEAWRPWSRQKWSNAGEEGAAAYNVH